MLEAADFSWPVRVYYEDTDAGGVVYHARYLHFFERARTEFLRAKGFEQDQLKGAHGILFVVRRMSVDYILPARFNDQLLVTSRIIDSGRSSSLLFVQHISKDGVTLCQAEVLVVCVNSDAMRPTRMPAAIRASMGMDERGNSRA